MNGHNFDGSLLLHIEIVASQAVGHSAVVAPTMNGLDSIGSLLLHIETGLVGLLGIQHSNKLNLVTGASLADSLVFVLFKLLSLIESPHLDVQGLSS